MPEIKQSAMQKPFRLDPCPAEERVAEFYDVPAEYCLATAQGGVEGYQFGEDGIVRQKCGGGRRIIRKRIGGS
jgi:hypothetical protein